MSKIFCFHTRYLLQSLLNSSEFRNLMYNKLLFIDNDETGAVCVVRAAEGVRINEDVWVKFIKIIIIWFIYHCWFCSIYISKFVISDVCDCWEDFIFYLSDLAVSFFKTVYALINIIMRSISRHLSAATSYCAEQLQWGTRQQVLLLYVYIIIVYRKKV